MKPLTLRLLLVAILLAPAVSAHAQAVGSDESSEYLIKAGVVYNFARLVEWPDWAAPAGQPIVIGVLGNDAFATVLSRVVNGKKIDDRAIVVKRLRPQDALRDCACRILFVAASQAARTDEIVQFQSSAALLTIAEAPDFARRGGIVALTLEDSRVRFAVNVDAASQASLTISSRLLALATIVQRGR